MHDLIIIGAGPAGITAGVYAARKKMNILVVAKDIGGQAAWSSDIENYTGYQFITGTDLVARFEEHMRKYGLELRENEEVINLEKEEDAVSIRSNKGIYKARTAIIASGKKSRELNVPGEEKFKNRGLTYCATCDGPLFTGKAVAVIGAGNSALDAALQLMKISEHVYIINNTAELSGDVIMRDKLAVSKIVTVLNNTTVAEITGDKFVNGINIKKDGIESFLSVQGVFVEIGLVPNADFAKGVDKNQFGEIRVDCRNQTNISGIFAAGDVTDVPEKQIIIAAGEGAKAALSVNRYLAQHKF
jgi:alkyl hydroperoxide reductase subunit F